MNKPHKTFVSPRIVLYAFSAPALLCLNIVLIAIFLLKVKITLGFLFLLPIYAWLLLGLSIFNIYAFKRLTFDEIGIKNKNNSIPYDELKFEGIEYSEIILVNGIPPIKKKADTLISFSRLNNESEKIVIPLNKKTKQILAQHSVIYKTPDA